MQVWIKEPERWYIFSLYHPDVLNFIYNLINLWDIRVNFILETTQKTRTPEYLNTIMFKKQFKYTVVQGICWFHERPEFIVPKLSSWNLVNTYHNSQCSIINHSYISLYFKSFILTFILGAALIVILKGGQYTLKVI